jgi:hypothetical protein
VRRDHRCEFISALLLVCKIEASSCGLGPAAFEAERCQGVYGAPIQGRLDVTGEFVDDLVFRHCPRCIAGHDVNAFG